MKLQPTPTIMQIDSPDKKPQAPTLSKPVVPKTQQRRLPKGYFIHPDLMPKKQPSFKGTKFENSVVRAITGKKSFGAELYKDGGAYLDILKVTGEHLKSERPNWQTITPKEYWARMHATGLRETLNTTWVRRYNKYNVPHPLAVFPTIASRSAKEAFGLNLKELQEMSKHQSLDVPVIDKNGKFCLDAVLFDTETTGTNTSDMNRPLDKIVQIGAIQMKKGRLALNTVFNQLVNPEMPIPEGAMRVHGITDEMVKEQPTMEKVLKPFVNDYLNKKNGIIVAYNGLHFDIPMLNNAIRAHNIYSHEDLKQKQSFKVIDPYLLTLRLHPYISAQKKLGKLHEFFFSESLEGAHDAVVDVKGMSNLLKYGIYKLDSYRVDKSVPLTVRDVLIFQNGGTPRNLKVPQDHNMLRNDVTFDSTYRLESANVTNFFDGYLLTKDTLEEITPVIGAENAAKLKKNKVPNKKIDLTPEDGHPLNPAEMEFQPDKGGPQDAFYVMKKNFQKVLGFADIQPHGDKSTEELIDFITQESEHHIEDDNISIWLKNPNPEDIKEGNDLPDFDIVKKVMLENET